MIPKKVSDVLFPNELYFTDLNPLHEEGQKGQIRVFRRDTNRGRTRPPGHLWHDPLASSGGQGMGVWMGLIRSPDPSWRP